MFSMLQRFFYKMGFCVSCVQENKEAGSKVILARSLFFVDFPVFTCKFGKISFL